MHRLIRQVNFVYNEGKIAFQTFWDDLKRVKEYVVVGEDEPMYMSKEEGNKYFRTLRKEHPDAKAIVVVDVKEYECEHEISCEASYGHYIVYVDGQWYCSCDTAKEVREEVERYKAENPGQYRHRSNICGLF